MKSSSQKIFSLSVIKTALMLLLITGITVALLAAVNFVTSPVIAENEKAETSKLIKTMFGDAEFDEITSQVQYALDEYTQIVYQVYNGDEVEGFAIKTVPNGFGGAVEMLVGINADGTVCGVRILSDSETATKSRPVKEESHLGQYIGKSGKLAFTDAGGEIEAVSGSTVTSTAVLNGVNSALQTYKSFIASAYEGGDI